MTEKEEEIDEQYIEIARKMNSILKQLESYIMLSGLKMLRVNDFDVHDRCFHSSEILKFCFLSASCTRLYTCRLKQCWVNAWFT